MLSKNTNTMIHAESAQNTYTFPLPLNFQMSNNHLLLRAKYDELDSNITLLLTILIYL